MKLTCVLGSPRFDGNSAVLAKHFLNTASKYGVTGKTYFLNTLNYKGCQGCMTCKSQSEKCALQDDLSEVLEEIRSTDILLIASSVYFGDVTSQTKGLIDRFYSYYTPDYFFSPKPSRLNPGKKMVMMLTQANPDESQFNDIFPRYDKLLGVYGFDDNHIIRACGVFSAGDVTKHQEIFQNIEKTVKKILPLDQLP